MKKQMLVVMLICSPLLVWQNAMGIITLSSIQNNSGAPVSVMGIDQGWTGCDEPFGIVLPDGTFLRGQARSGFPPMHLPWVSDYNSSRGIWIGTRAGLYRITEDNTCSELFSHCGRITNYSGQSVHGEFGPKGPGSTFTLTVNPDGTLSA